MSELNSFDLFCLGAFVLFMGIGAWRGLIRSLFQMASWIAGAASAFLGATLVAPLLQANLNSIPLIGLQLLAGFIAFLLGFLILRFIGNLLHGFINNTPFSGINRIGGALVGALKASILVGLLLSSLQSYLQRVI